MKPRNTRIVRCFTMHTRMHGSPNYVAGDPPGEDYLITEPSRMPQADSRFSGEWLLKGTQAVFTGGGIVVVCLWETIQSLDEASK